VLSGYSRALRGDIVELRVESPTFETREAGVLPARRELPLVAGLATQEASTVRLLIINKHPRRPARLSVRGPNRAISAIRCAELTADGYFDKRQGDGIPGFQTRPTAARGFPFEHEAGPHSLTTCDIEVAP
jgi:hypothetical protein